MAIEDAAAKAAAQSVGGAVAGTISGMWNAAAPHIRRGGLFNPQSNFFNGAVKSFKAHHKAGKALAAGGTAVGVAVGHGAVGAVIAVAAPIVLPVAVVGGVAIGTYKLVEHLRKKA